MSSGNPGNQPTLQGLSERLSLPLDGGAVCTQAGETAVEILMRRERDALLVLSCGNGTPRAWLARLRIGLDGKHMPHVVRDDLEPACVLVLVAGIGRHEGKTAPITLTISQSARVKHQSPVREPAVHSASVSVLPLDPALPPHLWASIPERIGRRIGARHRQPMGADFPFAWFDGLAYLEVYPEVADAVASGRTSSALAHYVESGFRAGREWMIASKRMPNEGTLADAFDGDAYLARYPDVARAVRQETMPSALAHYLRHGRSEGRIIRLRFDKLALHGTAIGLARQDAARTREDLARLSRSLSEIEDELRKIMLASGDHKEQVQEQLSTLARARQTRERELQARLGSLTAELQRLGASRMTPAPGSISRGENASWNPEPGYDTDVVMSRQPESGARASVNSEAALNTTQPGLLAAGFSAERDSAGREALARDTRGPGSP